MKSINHAQLRAFHAVATEGGFTKAARLLNVTQPTLSQEVKALEEAYGVLLFDRTRRSVALTELGRTLFAVTRRLFAAEQEALELLAGVRHLEGGTLAVGADGPFHAVPLLADFTRRHPGPTVTLSVGNSRTLLQGLLDTRIDVAVLADVPGDSRLYVVPLRRDPVMALLPRGHRLARHRAVTLAELAAERLVLREPGSMTRRLVERAFAAADLAPATPLEIESREAVVEAVAAGLGIGFVSAAEFAQDPRLALLPFAGVVVEMDEYVVCLRERRRLAVVRAFLEVARERAVP
ncbi:LysR family transcriptional regulator [Azospirillum sp. RWY-5-1]|uniref:LysR family transcriptional regulator n=1 Tax=Azospirillum oleiclasticum TaxID=2735135 RepID=A0ABX2TKM0_9PROT|nr:LysR substrate-binding domain-containing protein [Azospirillum oleiclasticum]NYZ17621.1 LysR family transcriptional regulator [Azospirillum oleiclasticum]NYZ24911.1 LysR family transcriptional regulator [Azospirillum oleiclasticum]